MKKKVVKVQGNSQLGPVFTWCILALLLIALMAKGLYNEEILLAYGIVASSFFIYSFKKYRNGIGVGDHLLLLLAVSYTISYGLNSANPRSALFQVHKILLYLIVYNLIKLLIRDKENILKVYNAIIAGILLLTVGAIIKYSAAGGSFDSSLAYLNSYAAILTVGIALVLFLQSLDSPDQKRYQNFLDYVLILYATALFITKSRGALLTFILLLFAMIIIKRDILQSNSLKLFFYLVSSLIVGTLLAPVKGLLFAVVVIVSPALLIIFYNYILKKINNYTRTLRYLLPAIITVLSIYVFIKGEFYTRLLSLSLNDINTKARYLYYIDGFKIFKEYPLFGTGGGGWLALYQQYQGHAYNTLEAHSFLIQYLVEGGLIGTLIFVTFIFAKWTWYLKERIKKETLWYHDCAFIITLGIIVHAFIDIDLSYPAFNIILFAAFAVLPERIILKANKFNAIVAYAISVILIICFMAVGIGRLMTNSFVTDSADGLTKGEIDKYESKYKTAIRIDPLNSEYYNYLAQMNINQGRLNSDQNKISEGLINFNRSIKYLPNFVDTYIIKAQILDSIGREKEAIESYLLAVDKAPLKNSAYDFLMAYYVKMGIQNNDIGYFEKSVELISSLRDKMALIEDERRQMWLGDYLGYSNSQCYYAGLASFYLKDYSQGLEYLKDAESSSGFGNLPEEIKKKISGLIYIGEIRLGRTPLVELDSEYIRNLETRLDNHELD